MKTQRLLLKGKARTICFGFLKEEAEPHVLELTTDQVRALVLSCDRADGVDDEQQGWAADA